MVQKRRMMCETSLQTLLLCQLGNGYDYRPWQQMIPSMVTSPVIKGYTADKLVVPAVSGVQTEPQILSL